MVIEDGELQAFRTSGDGEGLGEFGEFLGLFGEGGGAVDDVGCAEGVPASIGGEVTVGDGEECACGEVGRVEGSGCLGVDAGINRVDNRPIHS